MNPTLPPGNNPSFFGQKVSVPGIDVNSAGDNELILKDNYSTRTYYGSNGVPVMDIGMLPQGGSGIYFPDGNGVGIAQFGQFPDGTTSLKVAKPGVEVATASDSQLIFNSSQNVFKIVTSNTGSIPSSSSTSSTLIIAHGLTSVPFVMAAGLINGNYIPFPIIGINTNGTVQSYYQCYADATNAYFNVYVPGGTVGSPTAIRYYILQETAN